MIHHKLIRSDGTSLDDSVLKSLEYTSMVNSDTSDVVLGSACCDYIEFSTWSNYSIASGETLTYIKTDDSGTETQIGKFIAQKPKAASDNVYEVTAYDMMSKLESDAKSWVSTSLFSAGTETYTLLEFLRKVCAQCGVTLGSTANILNTSFTVNAFDGSGCTYRTLIKCVAEIGGCFAHFDSDGALQFKWYETSNIKFTIGDTASSIGMRSQEHENYSVAKIQAVRFSANDVEIIGGTGTNVYDITDNIVLASGSSEGIQAVVNTLLESRLGDFTYTPSSVSFPDTPSITCGKIVTMVDKHNTTYTFPIMEMKCTAMGMTKITSYGNENRNTVTAVSTQYTKTYTRSEAQREILSEIAALKQEVADSIRSVEGGIMIERKNEWGKTYELVFIDTLDEDTAQNCMIINNEGIWFSNNGINGEATQAMSIDGALTNEWIATWQLSADIINAGILKSNDVELDDDGNYENGTFFLDLTKGILNMQANSLKIGSKSFADAVQDIVDDGLEDSVNTVVQANAEKIASYVAKKQSQEDVFNALTNNGEAQGIYLQDGKIYINLEYAKAGTISADLIDVANLMITYLYSRGTSGTTLNKTSYVQMLDNGLDFILGGEKSIGIGYASSDIPLPYIVFGSGVDIAGGTAEKSSCGMIKKYENGIWIGDSADKDYSTITYGTGMFVDTVDKIVYKYNQGAGVILTDTSNVYAVFG